MRNHQASSPSIISYILIIIMAFLVGGQVYVSNQIATSGKAISNLQSKAVELEDANRKLLSENVEHLSLTVLSQKAQQMGFVEPVSVLHMENNTSKLAMQEKSF